VVFRHAHQEFRSRLRCETGRQFWLSEEVARRLNQGLTSKAAKQTKVSEMRAYDKHNRQVAAFVVAAIVVIGVGIFFWDRITNQHQQGIIAPNQPPREIPPSSNEVLLKETTQSIPEPNLDLFSNGQRDSTVAEMTTTSAEAIENQAASIKAWMKLLEENPNEDSVRLFIESLTDDAILELMEYFCSNNQFSAIEALLIPALKKKWGADVPFERLAILAADQKRAVLFRTMLTDIICSFRGIITQADRELIVTHLVPILLDKTQDEELRRISIMKLSNVLNPEVNEKNVYSDGFLNILGDITESPKVKGACVTALRRLNDKRAVPILMDKCLNYSDENGSLFNRHAVVALAKYAKQGGIDSPADAIGNVMKNTKDDRTYGSAVYALSLLGDLEFVRLLPELIKSSEYHQNPEERISVESALVGHRKAIIEALDHEDRNYVLAGVKACTLITMPGASQKLESLAKRNPEVGDLIGQALLKANSELADEEQKP